MVHYRNRLSEMDPQRLLVNLYKLEKSLKLNSWVKTLKFIWQHCDMLECIDLKQKCDLDVLETCLHRLKMLGGSKH